MDQVTQHIVPVNDKREHMIEETCWCQPTDDGDGLFIHHSSDKRETREKYEGKCSEGWLIYEEW